MPIYRKDYEDENEELDPNEIVVGGEKKIKEPPPPHENDKDSWKDRYGNLRSYSQKKLNTAEARIAELERQLKQNQTSLPKTKEEVEEWAKKYPEPYAFVKTLIGMDLTSVTEEVSSRFNEVQEREARAAQRDAELELARLHPDFFTTIKDSEEFKAWLDTKSKRMQDALYEDDDPIAAAEVITLYKVENKIKTTKKPTNDAAREVKARNVPQVSGGAGDYDFAESEIDQMSEREYDANEAAIEQARVSGRILYDLSGNAR